MSYPHDTEVVVDSPSLKGVGRVKGIQSEYPVIGKIYIVEMSVALPREDYPYTSVCLPEGCLKAVTGPE